MSLLTGFRAPARVASPGEAIGVGGSPRLRRFSYGVSFARSDLVSGSPRRGHETLAPPGSTQGWR